MTADEKNAYARGYNAYKHQRWPEHKPPRPPDELVAQLMDALTKLADGVDGELATLLEDDDWTVKLGPLVDDARHALEKVGKYCRTV